jgi:hypothetical protein
MAEATRRQEDNERRGLRGRNRAPAQGEAALEMHRLGSTGEVAVAAYLGLEEHLFKEQSARRGSADLPGNVEVKTRKKAGHNLLVQLGDNPEKLFVLATCDRAVDPHKVTLVGWAYGSQVMRKELVRELVRGRPCYVVPDRLIQPIETLKQELHSPGGPSRVLEPEDAWLTKEGDDLLLNLSEKVLHELGWEEGTAFHWEADHKTNSVRLVRFAND